MNVAMLTYADALAAVEQGKFVAAAFGKTGRGPAVAWVIFTLTDPESVAIAHHPNEIAHAAQGIGVISVIRRDAQKLGFVPA